MMVMPVVIRRLGTFLQSQVKKLKELETRGRDGDHIDEIINENS